MTTKQKPWLPRRPILPADSVVGYCADSATGRASEAEAPVGQNCKPLVDGPICHPLTKWVDLGCGCRERATYPRG